MRSKNAFPGPSLPADALFTCTLLTLPKNWPSGRTSATFSRATRFGTLRPFHRDPFHIGGGHERLRRIAYAECVTGGGIGGDRDAHAGRLPDGRGSRGVDAAQPSA